MTVLKSVFRCTFLLIVIPAQLHAQHVRPYNSMIGFEAGTGLTIWQNATPTYFATSYPFTAVPDTIHVPFRSGATPLFGFFAALSGDFVVAPSWSILAKFGYAERRGNWKSTEPIDYDADGTTGQVPVTSEVMFTLRTIFLEGFATYHFNPDLGPYIGGGVSVTAIANNHYDLTQSIEGDPANLGFRNLSSGQSTGQRSYGIGGEQQATSAILDVKALAGYSFKLIGRWVIAPEVELGYPLMSIWTEERRNGYEDSGFGGGPVPITLTASLSFRYRYH